mmetsp:Transcript_38234/g.119962  ORF Transcript_38234/g.119962 Transcript_38234/m.119962 type:complete len:93 (-) Transcript_38234:8-286(-)
MLRAVSVIGPRNEPLFFRRFLNGEPGGAEDAPDLRYHFMCHSALDVLEVTPTSRNQSARVPAAERRARAKAHKLVHGRPTAVYDFLLDFKPT